VPDKPLNNSFLGVGDGGDVASSILEVWVVESKFSNRFSIIFWILILCVVLGVIAVLFVILGKRVEDQWVAERTNYSKVDEEIEVEMQSLGSPRNADDTGQQISRSRDGDMDSMSRGWGEIKPSGDNSGEQQKNCRRKILSSVVLVIICWSFYKTKTRNEISQHKYDEQFTEAKAVVTSKAHPKAQHTDICKIAHAVEETQLQIKSYFPLEPVLLPSIGNPHVTTTLCHRQRINNTSISIPASPVGAVFAFKAARTGSTFFTTVLTRFMELTNRPTSMYWEPFCSAKCHDGNFTAEYQEKNLKAACCPKNANGITVYQTKIAHQCIEMNMATPPTLQQPIHVSLPLI